MQDLRWMGGGEKEYGLLSPPNQSFSFMESSA